MRRREFLGVLGGIAAGWPTSARAQQTMPVIGYVGTGSRESDAFRLPSFHKGLSESSYVEGQNASIEYRSAEGHNDTMHATRSTKWGKAACFRRQRGLKGVCSRRSRNLQRPVPSGDVEGDCVDAAVLLERLDYQSLEI